MQQKATKGGMPMKVAQRVDVSKFMSYIKVKRLSHKKGYHDFCSTLSIGASLRKSNEISVVWTCSSVMSISSCHLLRLRNKYIAKIKSSVCVFD